MKKEPWWMKVILWKYPDASDIDDSELWVPGAMNHRDTPVLFRSEGKIRYYNLMDLESLWGQLIREDEAEALR